MGDEAPLDSESEADGAGRALPYTSAGLLEAARRFASSAASNYSASEAPFFFLHAGASTELLIKAALCAASPALLLERQFNDDALIRIIGLEPAPRQAASRGGRKVDRPPYTVGLAKAMERYALLYGPESLGVDTQELELLKAARDLSAHGSGPREVTAEMHGVLVTLARVVGAVLPRLGVEADDFWGSHLALVTSALDEQRGQSANRTRTLIAAARARFEAKYEGVPWESLERLMTQTFWDLMVKPNEWARVCPACGAQGISRLRPELRRETGRNGKVRSVPGYKAVDFRCPVCLLALESEQLVDAADDFGAWEAEEEDLDFWAEDFGLERLSHEDLNEIGLRRATGDGESLHH